ncbi:MAG: Cytochrome c oxidase polypeptide [Chthoniobacter sp.]|jgi:caa(3)-type oxidase subunit IV|nr:Cytochrome c oxidase polypeptide [Chthoniobacter sp.]
MSDSHAPEPAHSAVGTDATAAAHDHSHDAEHVAKHIKTYLIVGVVLIVLTAVTVGLSYVDFGSHAMNWVVGMAVATFKVCLVGAIFMHLKGERPTIWRFLLFTGIFVVGMFLLTLLHWYDPIFGTQQAVR